MNTRGILPVIMSGGAGTRLWPLSRPALPKQFLPLTGTDTMFQLTVERVMDHPGFAAPIIVANALHQSLVMDQMAEKSWQPKALVLEPCGRNTAPAIALAALAVAAPDALILVMPSDHVIADPDAFRAAVAAARPWAEQGWLLTFGIAAQSPETGYGYIEMGAPLDEAVKRVARFVEKPDRATAQSYLDNGNFAWNGGIFLFRADRFLAELAAANPAMVDAVSAAWAGRDVQGYSILPDAAAFASSPSDSIDYAVMERSDRVAVVPVAMGWSDVGSWDALHDIGDHDAAGNVAPPDTRMIDAHNNLIWSDGPEISLIAVDDLIVVAGDGKVMITRRGESQRVKELATPPS